MAGYGLLPWGTGIWGIPHSSILPPNIYVNIINVSPTPGSFNISRTQVFTFTIKSKFALNPNTIYVYLDNKLVINGAFLNTTDFNISVVTNIDGISKDYTITPKYSFKNGEVFSLQISATDIYGNPSPPFWGGYIVIDERAKLLTPIYPLDGYSDVPIDLTIHFLINQLAAPDSGLDPATINVYVNDMPAILGGVVQAVYQRTYTAINLPTPGNITTPFEILLDYSSQYKNNTDITVSTSVREIGIVPVIGSGGEILDPNNVVVGNNVIVSSITKLANAEYNIVFAAPLSTYLFSGITITAGYQFKDTAGHIFNIAIIDVQAFVVTTSANERRSSFGFTTSAFDQSYTAPIFGGYFQGIYNANDLGDGKHINVSWHTARTTRPDLDLAYLVYYSTIRSDVFFEEPKLVTTGRKLPKPETVKGADPQMFGYFAQIPLPIGVSYYFGVRATEYPHSSIPVVPPDGYSTLAVGMTTVDGYSFKIPDPQPLVNAVSGSSAVIISIADTASYANAGGYIVVDKEIMKYTSKTSTTFIVTLSGRGQFGSTIASTHNAGETVKMYYGNYDDNTVIDRSLVSWQPPNDPHRIRPDLVTTDFSLEDGYHTGFEGFDYCGYHQIRFDELFNDQQCGTYVGGEFNGERGLFIYDRLLANEEQLLEITGQPVILLRRIWGGEACLCRTSRKDSSRVRSCAICLGTGFKGGYIRYVNPRRNDTRVMVHFSVNEEELKFGAQAGIEQGFKPNAWTLPVPAIKDRDIIVTYDEGGFFDWMYVVNNATRGKSMFNRYTRQRLSLSRLDRTDVAYQFKING